MCLNSNRALLRPIFFVRKFDIPARRLYNERVLTRPIESEVIVMMLVDADIRSLIDAGALSCQGVAPEEIRKSIGPVSYDLHALNYVERGNVPADTVRLLPGESVFVACKETLNLPADMVARVSLRNSRIRQGYTLDAPVYQPGHHTRVFFRLTNVSRSTLRLDSGASFAQLSFEKLDRAPDQPYSGAFQNEIAFDDMGNYAPEYKAEIERVDEKLDELHHMERNIYANTITLMSIFIALFSLININVDLAFSANVERGRLLISNLVTIGSIAFLVSLAQLCLCKKDRRGVWIAILALSVLLLIGVAVFGIAV